MWHFGLVWSDFSVSAEQGWRASAPHPTHRRGLGARGAQGRSSPVAPCAGHRAGAREGLLAAGCLSPRVASPQLSGAGLTPRVSTFVFYFSELCCCLDDADRQWFHKKEAESFLSSYWREPGGCLRQRRQRWQWARSRVGMGFHIHHHNGRSCGWWYGIPTSVFFTRFLYLNWILTLFVKKCSRTMTLFRFFYMGNFAKLYVFWVVGAFFQISWKEKFC